VDEILVILTDKSGMGRVGRDHINVISVDSDAHKSP
jgi:hypothetical protein